MPESKPDILDDLGDTGEGKVPSSEAGGPQELHNEDDLAVVVRRDWLTLAQISAGLGPDNLTSSTLKTPALPPPPAVLDASRRGQSCFPPATVSTPVVELAEAAALESEDAVAHALRDPSVAEIRSQEAAHLHELLADYIESMQPVAPSLAAPRVSQVRKRSGNEVFDQDLYELARIARGDSDRVVDRIDFQSTFRLISERYGADHFNTFLIIMLRLRQPLNIPHLGDDAHHWHVSAKAQVDAVSSHGPPRVLLFKQDLTPEGKKTRHQMVELVYILQGLSLPSNE